MSDANMFYSLCSQEACQTAGPVQGHGERSPEGGAVWKENAEKKGESLKNILTLSMDFKCVLCVCVVVCSKTY